MNFLHELSLSWNSPLTLDTIEEQYKIIKSSIKSISPAAKCFHSKKMDDEDDGEDGAPILSHQTTQQHNASAYHFSCTFCSQLLSFLYSHHLTMPLKIFLLLLSFQGESVVAESFGHYFFFVEYLRNKLLTNFNKHFKDAPSSLVLYFQDSKKKIPASTESTSTSASSTIQYISTFIPENHLYRFSDKDMRALGSIFSTITNDSLYKGARSAPVASIFYDLYPIFLFNKKSFLIHYEFPDQIVSTIPSDSNVSPSKSPSPHFKENADFFNSTNYLSFFLIYFMKILSHNNSFTIIWDLLAQKQVQQGAKERDLSTVYPIISSLTLNGLNPKVDFHEYFKLISKLIFHRHDKKSFHFFPLTSYSQLLTVMSLDNYTHLQSDQCFLRLKILSLIATGQKLSFKKLQRNITSAQDLKTINKLETEFLSFNFQNLSAFLESTSCINLFSSDCYDDLYPLLLPSWRLWRLKTFSSSFSSVLLSTILQYLGYINSNSIDGPAILKSADILHVFNYFTLLKSLNISYPSLSPLSSSTDSPYSNDLWIEFSEFPTCNQEEQSIESSGQTQDQLNEIFLKVSAYSQELGHIFEQISLSKSTLADKNQLKHRDL